MVKAASATFRHHAFKGGHMTDLSQLLQDQMPLALQSFDPSRHVSGLIIVDIVNGFATVGAGPLAPVAADDRIDQMIAESNGLARLFDDRGWPILAFLDSHTPGKPEPPYPPHCEQGSGHDRLVPALQWLEHARTTRLMPKDCINGFVGGIDLSSGRNQVVDWVNDHGLTALLVVGICTDICVMDCVLTLLSARNHGMMPSLRDIVVYEPACATYDLPKSVVQAVQLPPTATHPRQLTHHAGLYFMASRGAVLADKVSL
jgi:nicotinamidase-related amidase